VELLGTTAFGVFYALAVIFILATFVIGVFVAYSRFVGEEGKTWRAKLLRSFLGFVGEQTRGGKERDWLQLSDSLLPAPFFCLCL
jgi:hypothetical protein